MHSIFRFGSELFVSMLVFVWLGIWIDGSIFIQHLSSYWQVYFMLYLAVSIDFMTDRGNTMNELAQMSSKIIRYTLFYSLVVSIFLLFLLSFDILVFIGVWIGCILSLIGFTMIRNMARSIAHEEKAGKRQGYSNYALRYLLYGSVMAFLCVSEYFCFGDPGRNALSESCLIDLFFWRKEELIWNRKSVL